MRVHRALPQTRIYFFAINRAIDLRNRWDVIDQANAMVKQFAYRTPNFDYIESNTVLFDAKDEPIIRVWQRRWPTCKSTRAPATIWNISAGPSLRWTCIGNSRA